MSDFPFTFENIDREKETATFGKSPLIKINPGSHVLSLAYKSQLPKIYKLEVRADDTWLVGLPKTGTTWACELIWGVYHQADLEVAKSAHQYQRWMFLDLNAVREASQYGLDEEAAAELNSTASDYFTCDGLSKINNSKSPRFIKSHLPFSLLPPKLLDTCKVVYTARNFKDVWISMYYYFLGSSFYSHSTVKHVVEQHLQDSAYRSPVCQHVKEAWQRRYHPNLYFLFYEDMIKDLTGVIKKMSSFLGKELSDEQIGILRNHLSFDSMRANKYANQSDLTEINWMAKNTQFIRKGIIGDWKNHFDEEMLKKYNAWWKKHMADCDLKFPDE